MSVPAHCALDRHDTLGGLPLNLERALVRSQRRPPSRELHMTCRSLLVLRSHVLRSWMDP